MASSSLKTFFVLLLAVGLTAAFTYLMVSNHYQRERVERLRAELARVEAERANLEEELQRAQARSRIHPRTDSPQFPRPPVLVLHQTSALPAHAESAAQAPAHEEAVPPVALGDTLPSLPPPVFVPVLVPGWVRFVGTTNSLCKVRGTSSWDWQLESRVIGGFVEIDARLNPTWSAEAVARAYGNRTLPVRANAAIPLWSLRASERDGGQVTEGLVRSLLQESMQPKLEFQISTLTLSPKSTNGPGLLTCQSRGFLVIAGVTNLVEMPVTLNLQGTSRLVVSGSLSIRMTGFRIQPPVLRLQDRSIEAGDQVAVSFEWALARVETAPAVLRGRLESPAMGAAR